MHIAVIAANGRLGKTFAEAALKAGHFVRAGILGKNNLPAHARLEVIQCDATRADNLRLLLRDQEVVVSAIGHVKGSAPNVQTLATQTLIPIMKELGITRYVDVTGTGVRFPGDTITMIDRILNLAVQVIDPSRVQDGRDHQEVLKSSDLDWTTIRVLKLQNIPAGQFTLTPNGPTKPYVGRQEVSAAMLQVIEQRSFVRQAPIISSS